RSTLSTRFLLVGGNSGYGTLTVEDGGQVIVAETLNISYSGAGGAMTVRGVHDHGDGTGTASSVSAGALHVGHSGTGPLTIEDGGRVSTGSIAVYRSDSPLTISGVHVTGDGTAMSSSLEFANLEVSLSIGNPATVTISDGGAASGSSSYI